VSRPRILRHSRSVSFPPIASASVVEAFHPFVPLAKRQLSTYCRDKPDVPRAGAALWWARR